MVLPALHCRGAHERGEVTLYGDGLGTRESNGDSLDLRTSDAVSEHAPGVPADLSRSVKAEALESWSGEDVAEQALPW